MARLYQRILAGSFVMSALFLCASAWAAGPVESSEPRPFDTCRGWSSIPVSFDLSDVQSALTKEKRPFAFKVFARDASPYITTEDETSKVTFTFTPQDQLHQILVQSPVLQDEQDVLSAVGLALERHGAPHETLEKNGEEDAKSVINYIWRNSRVELTLTVVHYKGLGYWLVWEDYVPTKTKPTHVQERTAGVDTSTQEPGL